MERGQTDPRRLPVASRPTGRTRSIGVVGFVNPVFGSMVLKGVIAAAKEIGGWSLQTLDFQLLQGIVGQSGEAALPGVHKGIDGVLVGHDIRGFVETLRAAGIPHVLMLQPNTQRRDDTTGGATPGPEASDQVVVDEIRVGQLVGEHLRECGFRRFAYLGPTGEVSEGRLAGFRGSLERSQLGSALTAHLEPDWLSLMRPFRLIRWVKRLTAVPGGVGVMAFNDQVGSAIIDAALAVGVDVPDRIAVVGVDNTEIRCELARVPLSSVDINLQQVGYLSAKRLEELISGVSKPGWVETVRPVRVVARRSSESREVSDRGVESALRLIREHACDGLTPAEVLRSDRNDRSRSSLERRFRDAVGKSIGEEIRRVKLESARELLEATDLRLLDIAIRCGFSDLPHFSKHFSARYGQSPSRWRLAYRSGSGAGVTRAGWK